MKKREIRENMLQIESIRKKILQTDFKELGLTFGQGQPRVLYYLLQKGSMTQRELADVCRMDVTNMSRTLDRMEEAKLLYREKDPECRRSFLITLTDKGKEKAKKVKEGFEQIDNCICAGFAEEELVQFKEQMDRVIRNLNELQDTK